MSVYEYPQSRGRVGIHRIDITPPVGIYHRMWGAATHDQATGVHRPLTATVVAASPNATSAKADASNEALEVLVGVDHCLFWHAEMQQLLDRLTAGTGIDRDRIHIAFSHTHAAGLMDLGRQQFPGGDMIPAYLDQLAELLTAAITTAAGQLTDATWMYASGHCDLAANRDFFDTAADEFVCGFNPDGVADDTVLVARITDSTTNKVLGTVVNYACHPTTLAWDNTLISPDYVGAMREEIERATDAPCLFLQGASGDIGPREGFVGDLEIADRNGRQLAFAALSALESLPQGGTRLEYAGPVVSGATIGTWKQRPVDATREQQLAHWQILSEAVELDYRPDLPQKDDLLSEERRWAEVETEANKQSDHAAAKEARAMRERIRRRLTRVQHLDASRPYPLAAWIWRFGDAVWVALDGEHYNVLQRELRRHFEGTPVIVITLANGSSAWYLPDEDSYGKGLYQEDASILACGSLERVGEHLRSRIEALLAEKVGC